MPYIMQVMECAKDWHIPPYVLSGDGEEASLAWFERWKFVTTQLQKKETELENGRN